MINNNLFFKFCFIILFAFIAVLFPFIINAETISALSAHYNDVKRAIDIASSGDIVLIPRGSVTWNAPMQVNKKIIIMGSSNTITDDTIIQVNIPNAINRAAFEINTNGYWEISNLKIIIQSEGTSAIKYTGLSTSWRVHDCRFEHGAIKIYGYTFGLIDNCRFFDCFEAITIRYNHPDDPLFAGAPPLDGHGCYSWAQPVSLGTAQAVYVEDCLFSFIYDATGHPISSNDGARYVFRYNTVDIAASAGNGFEIDAHGNYYSDRGAFSYEIYHNTVTSALPFLARAMFLRGGQGVVFNNKMLTVKTGGIGTPIELINYRSFNVPICNYPGPDQINNLYIWGNTFNGSSTIAQVSALGSNPAHIQLGRDYFNFQRPNYSPYIYPHPLSKDKKESPKNIRIK